MHNKVTKIIDLVAINFLVYLISFVWLRYFLESLTACLLIALAVTVGLYFLFRLMRRPFRDKKALKAREAQEAVRYMTGLILTPAQAAMDYLYGLFKLKFHTLVKKASCLVDVDITVCPVLKMDKLTKQDIVEAAKLAVANDTPRLLIVANAVDKETLAFSKTLAPLDIEVADASAMFRFMKKYNRYPESIVEVQKQKVKFSEILNYAFNRKRSRGYILTGILLIATSFLTPFKIYYIVAGSILLALALFALVNSRFNDTEDTAGRMLQ